MKFKEKEQITISLTGSCNLQCIYCYMPKDHTEPEDDLIDFRFCMRGIKDFFQKSNSRCIRFFAGGEPTLAFPLIQEITQAARELAGDALRLELETNGYFSENIADWISENIHYLWISCDGTPEVQNQQRPCSQDPEASRVIYRNIIRFAQQQGIQFGVRATLQDVSVQAQINMIDFFNSLGVTNVSASPVFSSYANDRAYTANVLGFAEGFVPAYWYAKELNMQYLSLLMVNFDEPTDVFCQASIPTPRLTRDGYVSCCDWASVGLGRLPEWMESCIFGRYDSEQDIIHYDIDKIKDIQKRNVTYLGQNACKGCMALYHCAGGCIGKVMAQSRDMLQVSEPWCEAVRYLYEHLKLNKGDIAVLHP